MESNTADKEPALSPQRRPLTNITHAVNNVGPIPDSLPPKQVQKPRAASSRVVSLQHTLPAPPPIIKVSGRALEFLRVAFVGEACLYVSLTCDQTKLYQECFCSRL